MPHTPFLLSSCFDHPNNRVVCTDILFIKEFPYYEAVNMLLRQAWTNLLLVRCYVMKTPHLNTNFAVVPSRFYIQDIRSLTMCHSLQDIASPCAILCTISYQPHCVPLW
jgi:hypothetical protein